jgi:hypothetical protein
MTARDFTLQAIQDEDIPVLAKLSAEAFEVDKQTEMKGHGKVPYDMEQVGLGAYPGYLANWKLVGIKAVENNTKQIMGFSFWAFRGFEPEEIPRLGGAAPKAPVPAVNSDGSQPSTGDSATKPDEKEKKEQEKKEIPADDLIAQLEALTDADMNSFAEEIMPQGTKCLIVASLSVSPKFQKRGIGSALLKWGTDVVDANGVFAWVHSSEGAWKAYEKSGFKIVRTLDVDLDQYAPLPAPADRYDDGKWGHYVFRYMVYDARP